jgi:hypothetical protein
VLALMPLSSGGDVPQNLVFLSTRGEYYFVVVAISVLTLSPALVLWTGLCSVLGLASATAWIMAGMDRIVSFESLPAAPSREAVLSIVLDPDFLGICAITSTDLNSANRNKWKCFPWPRHCRKPNSSACGLRHVGTGAGLSPAPG